jgi:ribonuclease HII
LLGAAVGKRIIDSDWHEINRLNSMRQIEKHLLRKGYTSIAGVDEAGRGPLAGPVVAAACILPQGFCLSGIDDSKKLDKNIREELYHKIIDSDDIIYGVGIVDANVIDEINILQATLLAMQQAIKALKQLPHYLLIDGNKTPATDIPSLAVVKGDSLSLSIATASIIAKYKRDKIMYEYHKKWPTYDFYNNKGYATKKHVDMLHKHGACDIHRMTFDPLPSIIKKKLIL